MPGKKAKSASVSATSSAGAGVGPSRTKCAVCDQKVNNLLMERIKLCFVKDSVKVGFTDIVLGFRSLTSTT